MKSPLLLATAALALGGCVYYPAYQPSPIARVSPAQANAIATRPVDPATRDQLTRDNAQVDRENQALVAAEQTPVYVYPSTPYYAYPAYPYYGAGYYPWWGGGWWGPSLSLSFGYSRGWGGYHHGYGGWHGGGRFRR